MIEKDMKDFMVEACLSGDSYEVVAETWRVTPLTVRGHVNRRFEQYLKRGRRIVALEGYAKKDHDRIQLLRAEVRFLRGKGGELSMESLGLSTRAKNCFKNEGIETVFDIMCVGVDGLMSMHNLGKRTVWDIQSSFREYGVDFK